MVGREDETLATLPTMGYPAPPTAGREAGSRLAVCGADAWRQYQADNVSAPTAETTTTTNPSASPGLSSKLLRGPPDARGTLFSNSGTRSSRCARAGRVLRLGCVSVVCCACRL